jgi:hypothetical protein
VLLLALVSAWGWSVGYVLGARRDFEEHPPIYAAIDGGGNVCAVFDHDGFHYLRGYNSDGVVQWTTSRTIYTGFGFGGIDYSGSYIFVRDGGACHVFNAADGSYMRTFAHYLSGLIYGIDGDGAGNCYLTGFAGVGGNCYARQYDASGTLLGSVQLQGVVSYANYVRKVTGGYLVATLVNATYGVHFFDDTGTLVRSLVIAAPLICTGIGVGPDGYAYICTCNDGTGGSNVLTLWDYTTGAIIAADIPIATTAPAASPWDGRVRSLDLNASGMMVFVYQTFNGHTIHTKGWGAALLAACRDDLFGLLHMLTSDAELANLCSRHVGYGRTDFTTAVQVGALGEQPGIQVMGDRSLTVSTSSGGADTVRRSYDNGRTWG